MSEMNILYKNIGIQTKGANIGIVGSSGNIGHLVLEILDKYSEASLIKAFDLAPPKSTVTDRVKVYSGENGNVTNLDAVHEFVKDLDYIACVVGVPYSKVFEVEAGGMKNLVKASKETGRVKQISYISVLGVGRVIQDFQVTQKGKREAEQTLMNSGIAYTIFRPSGYIFDYHKALMRQVSQGYINVIGNSNTKGQPIAAKNVAEVVAAAIGNDKAYNQIFRLGGKEVLNRSKFAEIYSRVLDKKIQVRYLTDDEFKEMYKKVTSNIAVLLYMVKTDSYLEPGDLDKLEKTFPGIQDLFINYETKVKELLQG